MGNNMLKLQELISFLIESGIKLNLEELEDRLKVHKYVYILRYFGVYMGYDFNRYIRGAYSDSLSKDLLSVKYGRVKTSNIPPEFIRLIKGKDSRWLELATAMLMVKDRYNDIKDKEVLKIILNNQETNIKELENILSELKKYGIW